MISFRKRCSKGRLNSREQSTRRWRELKISARACRVLSTKFFSPSFGDWLTAAHCLVCHAEAATVVLLRPSLLVRGMTTSVCLHGLGRQPRPPGATRPAPRAPRAPRTQTSRMRRLTTSYRPPCGQASCYLLRFASCIPGRNF